MIDEAGLRDHRGILDHVVERQSLEPLELLLGDGVRELDLEGGLAVQIAEGGVSLELQADRIRPVRRRAVMQGDSRIHVLRRVVAQLGERGVACLELDRVHLQRVEEPGRAVALRSRPGDVAERSGRKRSQRNDACDDREPSWAQQQAEAARGHGTWITASGRDAIGVVADPSFHELRTARSARRDDRTLVRRVATGSHAGRWPSACPRRLLLR